MPGPYVGHVTLHHEPGARVERGPFFLSQGLLTPRTRRPLTSFDARSSVFGGCIPEGEGSPPPEHTAKGCRPLGDPLADRGHIHHPGLARAVPGHRESGGRSLLRPHLAPGLPAELGHPGSWQSGLLRRGPGSSVPLEIHDFDNARRGAALRAHGDLSRPELRLVGSSKNDLFRTVFSLLGRPGLRAGRLPLLPRRVEEEGCRGRHRRLGLELPTSRGHLVESSRRARALGRQLAGRARRRRRRTPRWSRGRLLLGEEGGIWGELADEKLHRPQIRRLLDPKPLPRVRVGRLRNPVQHTERPRKTRERARNPTSRKDEPSTYVSERRLLPASFFTGGFFGATASLLWGAGASEPWDLVRRLSTTVSCGAGPTWPGAEVDGSPSPRRLSSGRAELEDVPFSSSSRIPTPRRALLSVELASPSSAAAWGTSSPASSSN